MRLLVCLAPLSRVRRPFLCGYPKLLSTNGASGRGSSRSLIANCRAMSSRFYSPLSFPTTGFDTVEPCNKLEEETLPGYRAEKYYPAHLGQILEGRYQIVGKLGYGVTSTVWLCRDLQYVRCSLVQTVQYDDGVGIDETDDVPLHGIHQRISTCGS